MGKIWRSLSGEQPQGPGDRVLSRCGSGLGVGCWTSPAGALQMAIYLQRHTDGGDALEEGEAQIHIAYRSFHPEPVRFKRRFDCEGGTIDAHDVVRVFKMGTGRTPGQRSLTARVPDAVNVKRGPNGTQIEAPFRSSGNPSRVGARR